MVSTDLHVHITWDTEPTEAAKDFVRAEVLRALKEAFEEQSWLRELIQAEMLKNVREQLDRHHG